MESAQNDAAEAIGIKHPDEASVRTRKGMRLRMGIGAKKGEDGRRMPSTNETSNCSQ